MLQLPEMRRIEAGLDDWCDNIARKNAFDALPLRKDIERLVPRLVTLNEVKRFRER
ncbi:hypothetical protein ABC974_28780 [Sphingomonas oligophenolica]|uniref:Uncharacterized protein n=1 Tax=Sphingomonas oligophenolica TaxID=301154 RepID=A0ABU9YCV5_9SPHN